MGRSRAKTLTRTEAGTINTKPWSDKNISPSGAGLFLLLLVSLNGAALWFDWQTNRLTHWTNSCTIPLVTCGAIAMALGYWVIPLLRDLKAGQFIREEGPQSHLKKMGTPTMGGIFFVPVALVGSLIWSGFARDVLAVAGLTLAYGFIGWWDDWRVLQQRSNRGISPQTKLGLQIIFGILFCGWVFWQQPALTTVVLPLGLTLSLGWLFWPVALFVAVAESNATNLTDGLDGLAAGTVAIALLGLGMLVAPSHPDLMTFCACSSGACLGFLVHNHHPARVFMGDTGSLALGGALAGVGILTGNLFGLLILSGVFLVETLSVILQVSYYKATKGPDGQGKRLFRMAPFHHDLELSGWSETQVAGMFYLLGGLLAGLSLVVF